MTETPPLLAFLSARLGDFCRAGTEPINHAVDRMLRSLRVVDHPAPDYREAR